MNFRRILNFGFLFSARIAGALCLFVANLLIVRFLGLEALAEYAIFISLVSVLTVTLSLGYANVASIFVAEYSAKNQQALLKGFVRSALQTTCLVIAFLLIVLFTCWFLFNIPLIAENAALAIVVLTTASAMAFLQINAAVLVGMKKQVAALVPEALVRPVLFTCLAVFFLATGIFSTIQPVLWLMTLAVWLTLGFVLVRDLKLRKSFSETRSVKDKSRWQKASLPWMGIALLWDFMIDLMLLATSLIAGSAEIAILHICFRYRVLAGFGMRTIHTLSMPEISEQAILGSPEGIQQKLMQVNLLSLAYSLSTMFGFYMLGSWMLGLFDKQAEDAVPILLAVSGTMVVRAIFGPAPLVLAIHNFHLTTLATSFVSILLGFLFIWMCYPQLGIMAAAIGYTGANFIACSTLSIAVYKKTGLNCTVFSIFGFQALISQSVGKAETIKARLAHPAE